VLEKFGGKEWERMRRRQREIATARRYSIGKWKGRREE
jgi:hypothetical protein